LSRDLLNLGSFVVILGSNPKGSHRVEAKTFDTIIFWLYE
jgi:hypothetical protein